MILNDITNYKPHQLSYHQILSYSHLVWQRKVFTEICREILTIQSLIPNVLELNLTPDLLCC